MKTNRKISRPALRTHQGGIAAQQTPYNELKRTVTNCLLFESTFYESGNSIADRIKSLVPKCDPYAVADLAIYTRDELGLRHVALYVVACMAKYCPRVRLPIGFTEEDDYTRWHDKNGLISYTIYNVIKRADELAEFLSLYWLVNDCQNKQEKTPLSGQVRKGLALAFIKFDEYQLSKYNRDGDIKLRDVLFLVHASPVDAAQGKVWKKLVDNTLAIPDTWEVQLSKGSDKCETFTRLLQEDKLGTLALVRNLRNMEQSGVSRSLVKQSLANAKTWGILPYQFLSAMAQAPTYESDLEDLMYKNLESLPKLEGETIFVVDVSGSMDSAMSNKSTMKRLDAACGLAIQLREQCRNARFFTFSQHTAEVPSRRGMALANVIVKSQPHGGTYLAQALIHIKNHVKQTDRLIVITDEQAADGIIPPFATHGYILNVSPYKPGLSTRGGWERIDGFSERVVEWIHATEEYKDN